MKGNERYTVFMGVNMVSNIFFPFFFFFIWLSIVLQTCSIGFFLVLDRCLIACYVEMYAKLLFEEKKLGFSVFVHIHTNLPYILI